MSITILRIMLVCGIIGHAINLYCDRIISIFPNGALKLDDVKSIGKDDKLARLLEGVSEKIPLRSGILGAFALLLEFLGYFSLSVYMYGQSKVYGSILFLAAAFPLWSVIFTVLPIFLIMFPLRITGTLHYSAMVSMLAWMFFI